MPETYDLLPFQDAAHLDHIIELNQHNGRPTEMLYGRDGRTWYGLMLEGHVEPVDTWFFGLVPDMETSVLIMDRGHLAQAVLRRFHEGEVWTCEAYGQFRKAAYRLPRDEVPETGDSLAEDMILFAEYLRGDQGP